MRRAALGLVGCFAALAVVRPPDDAAYAAAMTDRDVKQLFATTCGWCHEDGGRKDARGPQLMDSTRSDDYLMSRIATGAPGKMPAYGHVFDYDQIQAIIRYIRNLKPDETAQERR